MNDTASRQRLTQSARQFVQKAWGLSDETMGQLTQYAQLLKECNEQVNLTALIEEHAIYLYHFADSLMLTKAIDMQTVSSIADVGSGAGFPGMVLALVYPYLQVRLVEVSTKRLRFLQVLIDTFELSNVTLISRDWRTFLRKTDEPIEYICARASVSVSELLRMFKPSSPYKHARLIYWASQAWQPDAGQSGFISHSYPYKVGNKKRSLVFFKQPI